MAVRQGPPVATQPLCAGIRDAAAMLGISPRVVFDLISRGQLETVKIGRRRLVVVASLHEYIDRLRAEARQVAQ